MRGTQSICAEGSQLDLDSPPLLPQIYYIHVHVCLALEASKSVHHFYMPPLSKNPVSTPEL